MGGDAVPMAGEQRIQAHGAGDVVKEVPSSFFVPVVGSCGGINCRISNKFYCCTSGITFGYQT